MKLTMQKEPAIIFCLVFVVSKIAGLQQNRNNETELIDTILDGYNVQARPIRNLSQPINVAIGFHLSKVLDLDERSEILTTYIWLDVGWKDELLQWNESDFGSIKSVTLLPTKVWLPDFGITNTADRIFYEDHMKYFRVSLRSDGEMLWHPGGIYKTSCPLDVTYFPFDTQVCAFQMLNWEYEFSEQMLRSMNEVVLPDQNYKDNGEWKLIDSYACTSVEDFGNEDGGQLGYINFYMVLERKAQYSIINVIVPIVLLSIMDLLLFWLPPESGEKVLLGITVLLSFSVFLLVVDERMPRTSDTVPILTIYLSSVMATTGLSLFLTVFILHLNYKTHTSPVPGWLKSLLCVRRNSIKVQDREETVVNTLTDESVNNNMNNGKIRPFGLATSEVDMNYSKKQNIKDLVEKEWKLVVARFDQTFFFTFLFLFSLLLIIMIYPYDTSINLDKTKCSFTL